MCHFVKLKKKSANSRNRYVQADVEKKTFIDTTLNMKTILTKIKLSKQRNFKGFVVDKKYND